MIVQSPITRLLLLISLFWNEFLPWYITRHPLVIAKSYFEYAKTFWALFSFVFLLKTLCSPWKNITDPYPSNVMNFGRVAEVFTLNATARMVGFVVRIATIAFGLVFQILLLAYFTAYLALWIFFPFMLAIGIPYLFQSIF